MFRLTGNTRYRVDIEYKQIPTIEIRLIPKGLHWGFVHIAGRDTKRDRLLSELITHKDVDCLRLPKEFLSYEYTVDGKSVDIPEDVDPCEDFAPGYVWDYWSLLPGARECPDEDALTPVLSQSTPIPGCEEEENEAEENV